MLVWTESKSGWLGAWSIATTHDSDDPLKTATQHCREALKNSLEKGLADAQYAVPRPINIDPGYVTPAKLVLATTKDRAHRIYLGRGIYAEVTLTYAKKAFQSMPWTYPDYRSEPYRRFFEQVRRDALEMRPSPAAESLRTRSP